MSEERRHLLAEIATLYYEEELSQAEIADRLGLSRSNVSRLLAEARQEGVVEITIHYPWRGMPDLEKLLIERFQLKDARILQTGHYGYSQVVQGLGVLAARYLETRLRDHMVLGISWSTGVYQVVNALRAARRLGVTVVQLTGAVGSVAPILDGPDLARWLAQTLGGQYRYLHAPLIVESAEMRQALEQERAIRETLDLARRADIALVGIGSIQPALSTLLQAGIVDERGLETVAALGAVGDICTYHYNIQGCLVPLELHRRIMAIDLPSLARVPLVIGVAGGREKAEAILGALRGSYINCLVTDEVAANEVLRLAA
jgi:DNA-binding transcriptional regulator LsrR (DeoR family)